MNQHDSPSRIHDHNRVVLAGLDAAVLGEYLAAIGLHRLVAGQADSEATLSWRGSTPVLVTGLSLAQVREFLLDDAQPAPLVAPWNGKDVGGFHTTENTRGTRLWELFRNSTQDRLAAYRATILAVDHAVGRYGWAHNLAGDEKAFAIRVLRNTLPDAALDFLDASVVISDDSVRYPPLLGTGGNIGRLDLVLNYAEHLALLLGLTDPPKRGAPPDPAIWLDEVFDPAPQPRVKGTPGQYDGAGVGGTNLGRRSDGRALVNPWVYVLGMHGTLAFASAMSRRQGADSGIASAPFYVIGVAADYASAAESEPGKGEFWAPIWDQGLTAAEISALAGEGRMEWRGRQARTGTDAVRSLKAFGVDRGISRFERFGFIERNGQAPVAVHVGNYATSDEPRVRLTAHLDRWVDTLNRVGDDRTPAGVRTTRRRLIRTLFVAGARPSPETLRGLLVAAASAERAASRSTGFRESASLSPIQPLNSHEWLPELDDGSVEFGIAAALMLGRDSVPPGDRTHLSETIEGAPTTLRDCLRATQPTLEKYERLEWARNGPTVPGLGERPIGDVLADVMVLRSHTRHDPIVRPGDDVPLPFRGIRPQFGGVWHWRVPASHAEEFAAGRCDQSLLSEWLEALLLLSPLHPWATKDRDDQSEPDRRTAAMEPGSNGASPLWRMLAPWASGLVLRPTGPSRVATVMPSTWPTRLRAGSVADVTADAINRYAMSGHIAILGRSGVSALATAADAKAARLTLGALLVPTRVDDLSHIFGSNTMPMVGAGADLTARDKQTQAAADEPVTQ